MTGIFKKLGRITAIACALALVAALLPMGLFDAKAAEVEVNTTKAAYYAADEYGYPTEFVSKKKTVKYDSGKIKFTTSYPKFMAIEAEDGNAALIKKLNKASYKAFYTDVLSAAKLQYLANGYEKGDNVVFTVDCQSYDITRLGNIISITEAVNVYVEGGAYPTEYYVTLNFNLDTGKRIGNFSKLFNGKFKNALIKKMKAQVKEMNTAEDSFMAGAFYEDIDWAAVKKELRIEFMSFNYSGARIIIPEGLLGPHALGTVDFYVDKTFISKYIKESKDQLVRPLSSSVIEVRENPSTGYRWNVDFISGDHYVELVGDYYMADKTNSMMTGVPGTRYFFFRALNPGVATIELVQYSPAGEEADRQNINVNVTEDLFFFEMNSEG